MITAIVRASLKQPAVVLALTALLAFGALLAAKDLPMDAVPDITSVQVQVVTAAPALSPLEVEQYISVPVERAMAGIPKSQEVRSVSKYGMSLVTIVFEDGTDIYFARQLVAERMKEAERATAGYGDPEVGPISSGLSEVYQFVVRNDSLTLMQLEEILDWQITPVLRSVPGIIEVNSLGGENRQYEVTLDPRRLQAAGLSLQEVVSALQKSNENKGGGYLEHNREHVLIGTDGMVRSLDDLRNVVIGATQEGLAITLAAVADVRFAPMLRRGASSRDGRGEVVVGIALMLLNENALTVTAAAEAKLAELLPSLPAGTKIEPFYDRSTLVKRTLKTVAHNLVMGALLVILVLFVLLNDWAAGLIVAAVIPLSLLFAVAAMRLLGLSGNLMSLGAIDFGLIVDGAVIIVEHATRRLREQASRQGILSHAERTRIVEHATLEVRTASVFGELVVAVVYLPLVWMVGTEGKLFAPMAKTVLLALFAAFLLSLTFVPVLTSLLVRPNAQERSPRWFEALQRGHHWVYKKLYTSPARTLSVGFVLFAFMALVCLFRLGAELLPKLDEGDLLLEVRRLPGVALTESIAMDQRIQEAALSVPEVAHAVSKTGSPELAIDTMGVEQTDVFVALKPEATWRPDQNRSQIGEAILAAVSTAVPEVTASLSQPIEMRTNELVAGIRSDVAVVLYGSDLEVLDKRAQQVKGLIANIEGVADLRIDRPTGLPYLRIRPDRAQLARYGLSVADINQLTETLAAGAVVGTVREGERQFSIVVRTAHDYRGDKEALFSLPLHALSHQVVPLGDVAKIIQTEGPATIEREGLSRRLLVQLNVRGRDVMSVVDDIEKQLLKLPPKEGYRHRLSGQFEQYQAARSRLVVLVPLTFATVMFLLWMAMGNVVQTLLIASLVPLAGTIGLFALWCRSLPFSLSAAVGLIALCGICVLNGVVLLSRHHQLYEQGIGFEAAIERASAERFRPILMTAAVAVLGFLPMALSTSSGSEVQRPLATVIVAGLIGATGLTLWILPLLFTLVHRARLRDAKLPNSAH